MEAPVYPACGKQGESRRPLYIGSLDKATNSNQALAVSRITQNDKIGLPEPGWEMRVVAILSAAALLLAGVGASHAAVRIAGDRGGQIGKYISKFQRLHSSGQSVVIDGLVQQTTLVGIGSGIPRPK
jgi:hypothetical protein